MAENVALKTVGDYLTEARTLLQDEIVPYRYTDVEIVRALNIALQEAYRLRPELFLTATSYTVPGFIVTGLTAIVPIDFGYRQALVYYIVGRIQLRDQEDTTDQRAGALMQKFAQQMLSIAS